MQNKWPQSRVPSAACDGIALGKCCVYIVHLQKTENWKDKVLAIFAAIGLMSLLMGNYSPQSQQDFGTPASHEWEMFLREDASASYLVNKKTGEVRKYDANLKTYIIPKRN